MQLFEAVEGGNPGPEKSPKVVVVRVRIDRGFVLLAGHGLPDGHPLDGEALDRAETLRADDQREGDEGVEVVYVEDRVGVKGVGGFSVYGATYAQQCHRGVAQGHWKGGVRVRVQHAVAVVILDPPAGWGNRAAAAVAVE